MIKKFGSLVAAVVLACTQANAALLPTTATVDVDLGDVLLLSDIGTSALSPAQVAGLAAFWNGQTPGSLSADAQALLIGRGDPNVWAANDSDDRAQFSVNSTASRTGFGSVGGVPTVISQDVFVVADATNSVFSPLGPNLAPNGPLVHNSENPAGLGGDFYAHGRGEISNVFSLNVLSDASVPGNANSVSFASSNSTNTTIALDLASAAAISLINGGSPIFTIRLYVDTILASINLTTDGAGSTAFGEFSLTGTITSFAGVNNTGGQTGTATANFGDTQVAGDGSDVSSITTLFGPSTGGGLASAPFISLTVNAATSRSIRISLALTSSAQVTTPTPEPASMALLGLGFAGLGAARLRRRDKVTAA